MCAKKKPINKNSEQIVNTSTSETIIPTIVYDEYLDMNVFEKRVFNTNTAIRWGKELGEWARRVDSLKVMDFFIEKGVHYEEVMRLCDKYHELGLAYKHAKTIVGSRREKGAIRNEYNAGIIHSSMSMYDPEWKKLAEWKASLAKDADKNKGNVMVNIHRYASTSLVPDKIIKEEME